MKTCTIPHCHNQHNTRYKLCPACRERTSAQVAGRREQLRRQKAATPPPKKLQTGRRKMRSPASYKMTADEYEALQEAPATTVIAQRESAHWTSR